MRESKWEGREWEQREGERENDRESVKKQPKGGRKGSRRCYVKIQDLGHNLSLLNGSEPMKEGRKVGVRALTFFCLLSIPFALPGVWKRALNLLFLFQSILCSSNFLSWWLDEAMTLIYQPIIFFSFLRCFTCHRRVTEQAFLNAKELTFPNPVCR